MFEPGEETMRRQDAINIDELRTAEEDLMLYENRYYRMKNGLIREAYEGELEELRLMVIATKEQIVIEFMRDKGYETVMENNYLLQWEKVK